MNDAVTRFAAALADRYRLERELGQGGSATDYASYATGSGSPSLRVGAPETG